MKLSQVVAIAEELWPVSGAEDWDKPGLVAGNPDQEIRRILFSVDTTSEVLNEARLVNANLIISHHPLLLKGVATVGEHTAKGSVLAKAIRGDVAIYSAHTNADVVPDGVSDTFAKALGLVGVEPLAATVNGGHGRVGNLPQEVTVLELVRQLTGLLPPTAIGVSSTIAPESKVSRIAVCGGAGDAFIPEAFAAGADVYITSDLRHHVAEESPVGLINVSHWASESLWLKVAAEQLGTRTGLQTVVSQISTDPWVFNERGTW